MPARALPRLALALVCALLTTLEIAGSPCARAALAVTGGTASQRQALETTYGALPACCRTVSTVYVCLLGDGAMDACLQACAAAHAQRLVNADAVDGFYQNSARAITLRAPSPAADVSATFAHEYGHFVWMNVLSADQRDRYRQVYGAQRAAGRLVSPYAAVSVEEGFAEAFSFYVREPAFLAGRDAPSCRFLTDALPLNKT